MTVDAKQPAWLRPATRAVVLIPYGIVLMGLAAHTGLFGGIALVAGILCLHFGTDYAQEALRVLAGVDTSPAATPGKSTCRTCPRELVTRHERLTWQCRICWPEELAKPLVDPYAILRERRP